MNMVKSLAPFLFAGVMFGCSSPASNPGPPVDETPDADQGAPPTPDARVAPDSAGKPPADAAAPAPDLGGGIDPDPTPPRDGAAADLPPATTPDAPPATGDGGGTFAVGVRVSLEGDIRSRWTRTRETIKEEGGMTVFTGVFEANRFGGPQGHNHRLSLKPGREYLLEYKVRFDGNFPFTRGGKLPGLAGGNAPTGCVNVDANGFSARQMWRTGAQLVGYIYDQTQSGGCGNNITTSVNFKSEQWYSLKQRVRLNTGNTGNGVLQLWVDDRLVIDRMNMRYMNVTGNNLINSVLFHSFFGGSTQDWAPSRECSISFAEVFATLLAE